jgi:DNA-nicking Smr family endonuclease
MTPEDAELWRRAVADVAPLDAPTGARRRGLEAQAAQPRARRRDAAPRVGARLDLHGMTQGQAHAALTDFLATTPARAVLVITGASGVLRQAVPLWCESPPLSARVRAVEPAPPTLGGAGAFVLRLARL